MWVIPVWDFCVCFFAIDRCWLNFILHVLLFFSQLQPPPNPSDSLIPASDYSEEPKWVMFVCILFYVAIIMFNNFGHVPFFSMTGKILSQGKTISHPRQCFHCKSTGSLFSDLQKHFKFKKFRKDVHCQKCGSGSFTVAQDIWDTYYGHLPKWFLSLQSLWRFSVFCWALIFKKWVHILFLLYS